MFDPENYLIPDEELLPSTQKKFTYDYPMPCVTADIVLIAVDKDGKPWVLLIKRKNTPYRGSWALPGGHLDVDTDQTLLVTAERELEEETGIDVELYNISLKQLHTYGKIGRDERGRYVTVAFYGIIDRLIEPQHGSDASNAKWVGVDTAQGLSLAWDHNQILNKAFGHVVIDDHISTYWPDIDKKFKAVNPSDLED